jgi:hypothetical protein
MKLFFALLSLPMIFSCKARSFGPKASNLDEATLGVTQSKRAGGLDGFNEMLSFNDHFWVEGAKAPTHRCIYTSIGRVRTEDATKLVISNDIKFWDSVNYKY